MPRFALTPLRIMIPNAPIHSLVSFIGKVEAFDATLRTTNDPLNVLVPKLPISAALSLNARTSNDVAILVLPATFEGRLWQSTRNSGTSKLEAATGLHNPARERRVYVVTSLLSGKKEHEDRVRWVCPEVGIGLDGAVGRFGDER